VYRTRRLGEPGQDLRTVGGGATRALVRSSSTWSKGRNTHKRRWRSCLRSLRSISKACGRLAFGPRICDFATASGSIASSMALPSSLYLVEPRPICSGLPLLIAAGSSLVSPGTGSHRRPQLDSRRDFSSLACFRNDFFRSGSSLSPSWRQPTLRGRRATIPQFTRISLRRCPYRHVATRSYRGNIRKRLGVGLMARRVGSCSDASHTTCMIRRFCTNRRAYCSRKAKATIATSVSPRLCRLSPLASWQWGAPNCGMDSW